VLIVYKLLLYFKSFEIFDYSITKIEIV